MSNEKTYYESQKDILDRMLSRTELSKTEGSLNYTLNAPFSFEVESIKSDMDEIIKRNNIIDAYKNGYEEEVEKYNVGEVLPVFIFFDGDKEILRVTGEKSEKEFLELIKRLGE